MAVTMDASRMRAVNKRAVLALLYQREHLSRADVSRLTGLNRATVSSLVEELLAEKFVRELGAGPSNGGRKPTILTFNAEAGYTIGIDVQITHLTTVLINARREIVVQHRRTYGPQSQLGNEQKLVGALVDEINSIQAQCPPSAHGLMGIGIGLPGLVDHREGRALYLPNVGIRDWAVAAALARHVPVPVFIDNDANCGAWGQYLTNHIAHQLFVNVGVGLGVGMVIDGQLYRGRDGIAGEAGHYGIRPEGVECSCGNLGCWEQYASERGLARALRARGVAVTWPFPADFVETSHRAARAGSQAHQEAFAEVADHLGIGVVNLLNILNPDTVYLSGTVGQVPVLLSRVQALMESRALESNRQTALLAAPLNAVALGAAGLALTQAIDLWPVSSSASKPQLLPSHESPL